MTELVGKSIRELKTLLSGRQVSAREVAEAHLKHIENQDGNIDAFLNLTGELALTQADQVDRRIQKGEKLPDLAGIPVAVKDNMCVPGYPTTCASKILEGFKPPHYSTAVKQLVDCGALILGKTNLDEFAMGSSTENSGFKPTRNPWQTKRVPGGSSGGSAAAVSSGFVVTALGSDTGGSIRQPASLCGVVGMKPTYGMVSRFGLVAFASSLDQIGPLGRSVEDVAITLQTIVGHDPKDSTSLNNPVPDFSSALTGDIKGLRVGVISDLMGEGIDGEVRDALRSSVGVLEDLGAELTEVAMPTMKHAISVYYIIATAEASANLARYDGVRYGYRAGGTEDLLSMYMQSRHDGFGDEVKRRIMLGTYGLSSGYYDAYYKKAQQVRRLMKEDFDRAFSNLDLLVCPTSPTVAFEIGAKTADPLQMYLTDIATIPANLAGIPGISIPCGFARDGLPIGMQLLAPALGDATLLNAAYAFESKTEFHTKKCPTLLEALPTSA